MSLESKYTDFINIYKAKKFHRSYSLKDYDLYSYASNKGKFGVSNVLIDILIQDFSPIEVKLFFAIINTLKQSADFEESAIVHLKHSFFENVCSVNVFGYSIKKYVEYEFLIPTPKKKYFIVSPLYVNKFYKSKIEK
mgnify:FL=1